MMVMEPLEDWLEFEEGFDEQWGKSLLMGTNFFSNPKGNVINIEFEETLLAQRQIRVVEQIMWLYELNDVYYVCSLYCGDRYFRIRVFDLDWNEVVYPGRRNNGLACDPLSSVRFFQAFRVRFIPNTLLITLLNYFQIFCEHKVSFNDRVKWYDPLSQKFEIYVDTDEGNYIFVHRIFSAEGVEIDYKRDLGNACNSQVQAGFGDYEKILSSYDVQSFSLYMDAKFVKECLVKGRKTYVLTNGQSQYWNCKIR
ncbi:hypothetical protein DEO72_LG2g3948 [Vigna unguiculata]|uniref:Uncharacterized protein n=1 Tax=Vigna unguiculata TaxID=3917 RepID=A0A4D6L4Z9_VIGUN|nr:hypothetical protein DEO72_LG2g3948 [Vigna unguiculata]